MTVTIAQLSDVHLGFDPHAHRERNEGRLLAVLATVADLAPDAMFVTGDLTEHGAEEDYRRLRDTLAEVTCPVHVMVGNHDRRAAFARVFPETPRADGFVQYAVDVGPLRCIALDTLDEGRHGGAFCERRATWLAARLDEAPERPTLILLHHPPVATGIAWMDPDPGAAWIERLMHVLRGRGQVVGLAAGHVHAPSVSGWEGVPVTVAPSVAPGLGLTFAPIDPERPDERPMIVDGVPGFAIHRWDGSRLTTHFAGVQPPVIARYTPALQPLVRQMIAEREPGRN